MTKAEYLKKTIKEYKLVFGNVHYKYDPKNQTILFIPEKEKDSVTFDFVNNTVTYQNTVRSIQDTLPFVVEPSKNGSLVYVSLQGKQVPIIDSLRDYRLVANVMEAVSQTLTQNRDRAEIDDNSIQKTPITLHKNEAVLPFFTAVKLPFDQDIINNAKNRLKDTDFIQAVLKKESGDQTRRIYTRYIPFALVTMTLLCLIGWSLGFLWVYLSYLFYVLGLVSAFYFILRFIIPSMAGADRLYLGKDNKYPQRLGIVLPFRDLCFLHDIPANNNIFTKALVNRIYIGEYDVKFVLSYTPRTEAEVMEREYYQILDWIGANEMSYKALRAKINELNYEGTIQFVISSLTGYVPDSTGLEFYRSEIHPHKDNISVYHLEQLTPNRILLGYSNEDYIFIPYAKQIWQNISP